MKCAVGVDSTIPLKNSDVWVFSEPGILVPTDELSGRNLLVLLIFSPPPPEQAFNRMESRTFEPPTLRAGETVCVIHHLIDNRQQLELPKRGRRS